MATADAATFRANPRYALVPLDRLGAAERARLLADARATAGECYGLLRPRDDPRLPPRAASPDTALLFLTLAAPGPLPAYVVARLGTDAQRAVMGLVLDGVLEVEHAGAYVCGAEAVALLTGPAAAGGRGRLGELSRAALQYGQALAGHVPEDVLARRLYAFGRRPVTATLRRRLLDDAAVAAFAGVGPCGPAHADLAEGWQELAPMRGGDRVHWRCWRARAAPRATTPAVARCKLYVSPAGNVLGEAVAAVATLATAPGISAFKLGAGVEGISRPDKLVVYFEHLDDLRSGAATLRERLEGCPAHGVPVTAAITPDGLLSWGADPPGDGTRPESWRSWVTARLAAHLATAAKTGDDGVEPWRFALERLRLSGVDTDTWVTASGMWDRMPAAG